MFPVPRRHTRTVPYCTCSALVVRQLPNWIGLLLGHGMYWPAGIRISAIIKENLQNAVRVLRGRIFAKYGTMPYLQNVVRDLETYNKE